MKKENVKAVALFVILILLIGLLFIYHDYSNYSEKDVDRKVEIFFNEYSYNDVYNQSNVLFFNAIKILNPSNFTYEKDQNDDVIYYSINDYNQYKKIIDFDLVKSTIKSSEVDSYLLDKKILEKDGNYYIEEYKEDHNNNYIGSILDIKSHDDNYIYVESTNYYCENEEYVGYLKKEPTCKFAKNTTNFTIELENNNFRITSLEDIKKIY